MQRHFDQDLAHLKQQLLRMGGLVESQIQQALQALVDRDLIWPSTSSSRITT